MTKHNKSVHKRVFYHNNHIGKCDFEECIVFQVRLLCYGNLSPNSTQFLLLRPFAKVSTVSHTNTHRISHRRVEVTYGLMEIDKKKISCLPNWKYYLKPILVIISYPLQTYLSEILIKNSNISLNKIYLKMPFAQCRHFFRPKYVKTKWPTVWPPLIA